MRNNKLVKLFRCFVSLEIVEKKEVTASNLKEHLVPVYYVPKFSSMF